MSHAPLPPPHPLTHSVSAVTSSIQELIRNSNSNIKSTNTNNSNNNRDGAPTSPAHSSVAVVVSLLEPLELELDVVTTRVGGSDDVRYVLTVHHRSAHAVWKHRRSFDEYFAFQQQIVRVLHHGHFCSAGCPWLESFLTSAFLKTTSVLLSQVSTTLIERRRKTILHVLQTIQQFLINRLNHTCAHIMHHVAYEFLAFIYGDVIDSHRVLDEFLCAAQDGSSPTEKNKNKNKNMKVRGRAQSTSALFLSKHIAAATAAPPSALVPLAHSDTTGLTNSRGSTTKPALADLTCALCGELMPVSNVYVLRLRCGHRFHDECILPKLNEALKCPTCGLDEIP